MLVGALVQCEGLACQEHDSPQIFKHWFHSEVMGDDHREVGIALAGAVSLLPDPAGDVIEQRAERGALAFSLHEREIKTVAGSFKQLPMAGHLPQILNCMREGILKQEVAVITLLICLMDTTLPEEMVLEEGAAQAVERAFYLKLAGALRSKRLEEAEDGRARPFLLDQTRDRVMLVLPRSLQLMGESFDSNLY